MHKDLHLLLDTAKEARVKLPALETVDEIYELSSEEGWDDLDYAATIQLLEKWAGLERTRRNRKTARRPYCGFSGPATITRLGSPGSIWFFSRHALIRRCSSRFTANCDPGLVFTSIR